MTTPSPAAMRAATDIIKTVLPFNQRTQDRIVVIAEIIDRETKLPDGRGMQMTLRRLCQKTRFWSRSEHVRDR